MGDNRTCEGEGDDEVIVIDLSDIANDVEAIAITAIIFEATKNRQNFGQVQNAYIRLVNEEIARYNLTNDYSFEKSTIIYKTSKIIVQLS